MGDLHFIRPWWLLAIPVGLLISAMIWRLRDARLVWRGVISPALLKALLVRSDHRRRLRPIHLITAAAIVTPLTLAGPTWKREPSPFAEETAALVIVIEASRSMNTPDVAPSRLERGSQKLADLLALRPDTDAALIAYAGTAHVAMPMTRDTSIIAGFAAALDPDVMPEDGDSITEALALASRQFERSGRAGSILLISDGVPDSDVEDAAAAAVVPVHVLATVAGKAPASLDALARATRGSVTLVSPDNRDVERIAARAARDFGRVSASDGESRWRDFGYWLVPPVALITLVWSRRGWAVRYSGFAGAGGTG